MEELVYKEKGILGLDIGTELIKYVQLEKKGKLTKLVGYGKIEVPQNIIIEGIVSEPENLAKIVKKELADPPWGKITAAKVVSSLPESKIFTRIIELPSISDQEIEEAIAFEIEQSIPIAASDLYTDWQIIDEGKKKVSVLLAAAPRGIVDSYMQLFNLMDLEPISLEISLSAIAKALIPENKKNKSLLILDIGGSTTNMATYDEKIIVTGSHPVGYSTISESLMTVLGVNKKESEALIKKGISDEPSDKGSTVIMNEFKKVITEVERMVKYHQEKNEKDTISEILLCGGLGAMNGLDKYLSQELNIPTKVGNPWTNISIYPLKPVPKNEAPMYANAIGLCLRGMNDE